MRRTSSRVRRSRPPSAHTPRRVRLDAERAQKCITVRCGQAPRYYPPDIDRRFAKIQRHQLRVQIGEMQQRHLASGSKRSRSACVSVCRAAARAIRGAPVSTLVAIAACTKSRREITLFAYRRRFDGQSFADTGKIEFERYILRRSVPSGSARICSLHSRNRRCTDPRPAN